MLTARIQYELMCDNDSMTSILVEASPVMSTYRDSYFVSEQLFETMHTYIHNLFDKAG